MPYYRKVSPEQAEKIRELEAKLGSKTLRTLLRTGESKKAPRILSNLRVQRLTGGSGKLSEEESVRLDQLSKNARAVQQLKARGDKRGLRDFRVNRAIRDWLAHGKLKGSPNRPNDESVKAIKALRYLGVDIDAEIFYLKG